MSVKCISCGNSTHYQLHDVKEMMYGSRENFTYFECLNCGCLQIVEVPASLNQFYDDKYYSFQSMEKLSLTKKIVSLLIRERNRYSFLGRGILGRLINIRYHNPEGNVLRKYGIKENWKILDIGCGAGLWLFSLNGLGFTDLYGEDPYIEKDINECSVKIQKGTIFEIKNIHKFNLIRSNHSFEHIMNQPETMRKIYELLAPEGLCMISMPVKTETIWKKYGTNWVQIDAPRHLIIHTVESFTILARNAGFEIIDVIFNSTAFQFWGSEQYMRDIPLKSEKSYSVSHRNSIFSRKMIQQYHHEAEQLNYESQGDMAIFVLKPLED